MANIQPLINLAVKEARTIGGIVGKAGRKVSQVHRPLNVPGRVTSKDAADVAKSAVGKYPPSRPPRAVPKPGTGLSQSERRQVSVKQPVTRTQGAARKPEDIARIRAAERSARVGSALTPIRPRGVAARGKSIAGAKPNPRTVTVAKPSAAASRARQVNPGDRKLDASRRAGMRDANESRTLKTPAQRELEQRTSSRDNIGSPSLLSDPQMREANRRVNEGLKEIKRRERGRK